MINDTINTANALADIALGIIRDLRSGLNSLNRQAIRARIEDYFEDPDAQPTTAQVDQWVIDIASHPAIRNSVRN